jgi:histidinol-phosphate aminotransferase
MAATLQAQIGEVMLDPEEFTFDMDKLLEAARTADVVVVCSPNNPTGGLLEHEALVALLKAAKGLVLVDEAYHEFSEQTAVPLLAGHRNLVVLRTFSKAMSMAGLRFGYMMAHPEIAREIYKSKLPYNVNVFTLAAAEAVIEHRSELERNIAALIRERNRVFAELNKRPAVKAFASRANFILIRTAMQARALFDGLYAKGVLVRDVSAYPLLDRCLRVSIGLPEENNRFLQALDHVLENKL